MEGVLGPHARLGRHTLASLLIAILSMAGATELAVCLPPHCPSKNRHIERKIRQNLAPEAEGKDISFQSCLKDNTAQKTVTAKKKLQLCAGGWLFKELNWHA